MTVSIGDLKFIDLMQLMQSSLKSLVNNLYDKENKYKHFTHMNREFLEAYGQCSREAERTLSSLSAYCPLVMSALEHGINAQSHMVAWIKGLSEGLTALAVPFSR